jgi:uncharacterized tellurite resistance protein B-like protein
VAVNWPDVRYRGDAQDVQELATTYLISDYLATVEENRRQLDRGIREKLIKHGIRLSERLSPRIYRLSADVCQRFGVEAQVEVFCLPAAEINAFATMDVRETRTYSLIGVTSSALERLEDAELRFILGHEGGHILFGNNRLDGLISTSKDNPGVTVLPAFGESLFLRWRKKAELSADRAGLLAAGDFRSSATSLLKATFGLSAKNLNLDIEALVEQVDEIKGHPELMAETFASHPLLPIRLKALELFSRSEKARRNGFTWDGPGPVISDAALEDQIDELVHLTRRYPFRPIERAMMQVVALGGALLLGADGEVSDEEVKILIQILHRFFTDEPEAEIVTDPSVAEARLPEAIAVINADGDTTAKHFVLSRLTDIVLADGALMEAESAVILDLASRLGLPSRVAYGMVVNAAQAVGFRSDVKLNRLAEDVRRSLQAGFAHAGGLRATGQGDVFPSGEPLGLVW